MKRISYIVVIIGLAVGATATAAALREPYSVPTYATPEVRIWEVQSVDTMKTSRDRAREFTGGTDRITEQVRAIAATGATHIAIGTPYNVEFDAVRKAWVDASRAEGLSVWFRGNWAGWEQWFEYEPIDRRNHIIKTRFFIREHPDLFQDGDIFEPCPECENGGPGDPRFTGDITGHRAFIKELAALSVVEFDGINKDVQILFAMNGDVAREIMDADTTKALDGVVAMDHYVATTTVLSEDLTQQARRSDGTVFLSEFGTPIPDIHGSMTEVEQAAWIRSLLHELATNRVVTGLNYWVDRGGSTALWNDTGEAKAGVDELQRYYTPYAIYGVVVDELGYPLKNVSVRTPYGFIETDEEGYFKLPTVDESTVVSIWKEKFIPQDVSITKEEAKTQLQFTMEREKKTILFMLRQLLNQI